MGIPDLYAQPELTVSFEFFPPRTPEGEEALFRDAVPALRQLGPSFCSVTYGAGGGTKATTLRIVNRLRRDHGIEAMPHLTCSGSTREMHYWCAPDLGYLPVRIEQRKEGKVLLSMVLKSAQGLDGK